MTDGFTFEDDEYRLFFEDERLAGLEVDMDTMSVLQALEFDRVRFREVHDDEEVTQRLQDLAEILAKHLVRWNLRDKRKRLVPLTAAGILSQPERLILALVAGYVQALRGVPAPLGRGSNDGPDSDQVPSIPMEPLS